MQNVAEILRLINNLVRLGKIAEVDAQAARCRVSIGEIKTNWLRWVSARAGTTRDWDPPTVGEQVVVLAPGGDLGAAVVLTGVYQQAHSAPASEQTLWKRVFPDGAEIQYNHDSHTADITLPAGAILNLVSDGGVNITGDVSIKGNLAANGNVSDSVRSMADDRAIYNQHDHNETGSKTKTPNQAQ
jgi:phage baseplate assembly protein V